MEPVEATWIGKISCYKAGGLHTVSIPIKMIREMGLEKGDYVEIRIRPLLRPEVVKE